MTHATIELARTLVRFASVNPPGEEKACSEFLSSLLTQAGFSVEIYEFAVGRPSIVARRAGTGEGKPLCFTGHVDVVPVGDQVWSADPFAGEIRDGKLFGRGSCDMKSGIAAFVTAAIDIINTGATLKRGISLFITAGEETGCEGAFDLARKGVLGDAELLVVAEPTSNRPVIAHKGSVRLRITADGRSAHSSMPELGDNAITKVIEWVRRIEAYNFGNRTHPLLGGATAAVTTIFGGQNVNSIPDSAGFTLDIRTLPLQDHAELIRDISKVCGEEARIQVLTDFNGFATDPADASLQPLLEILRTRHGSDIRPLGAPYFTDASALVPALKNTSAVILGPGDTAQCHRTDEACSLNEIEEAYEIYCALIHRHCIEQKTAP